MATVNHDEIGRATDQAEPILFDGQRLDQPAFHELYLRTPEDFRAELIEGVVHVMASPVLYPHSSFLANLVWLLKSYSSETAGLGVMSDGTTKLDPKNEFQPDAALLILPGCGGRNSLDTKGYLVGCPELVAEVSASSLSIDLGKKKRVYEESGASEHIVVDLQHEMLLWSRRLGGRWIDLPVDPDGVYRSVAFPGLWIDARAFFEEDDQGLMESLRRGLATPEHAEFVAELGRRRANRP